jgi:hypothetical protein
VSRLSWKCALTTELGFAPRRPEDLFAPVAHSAARLFAEVDWNRVRKCGQCVLHFYDTSKKRTRHWRSMQLCGNRLNVPGVCCAPTGSCQTVIVSHPSWSPIPKKRRNTQIAVVCRCTRRLITSLRDILTRPAVLLFSGQFLSCSSLDSSRIPVANDDSNASED